MRDRLSADITAAVSEAAGVAKVVINFGVMNDEEREAVKKLLRGDAEKFNPFAAARLAHP
jgi:ATP-binding protein involved in chromosome partitioning